MSIMLTARATRLFSLLFVAVGLLVLGYILLMRPTSAAPTFFEHEYSAMNLLHASRLNVADDYAHIELLSAHQLAQKCEDGAAVGCVSGGAVYVLQPTTPQEFDYVTHVLEHEIVHVYADRNSLPSDIDSYAKNNLDSTTQSQLRRRMLPYIAQGMPHESYQQELYAVLVTEYGLPCPIIIKAL